MRNLLFYIFFIGTFASYSQNNCVDILTTTLQDAACNSPTSYTGSATITVLNGSGNYSYEWFDTNFNPLFPPQTSVTANNLPPGDYIVEITDVDNNCVETDLITVGYVGLIDASISLSTFNYNPVFYNQWTFDTVKIYNHGCETRVRPEFRVSHSSGNINTNDFSIDYYDALTGQWLPIVIQNDSGQVTGYYGDPLGSVLNQPVLSQVVRVKFHPSADIGLYTAENDLWEVDINGNHIQKLDSLEFVSVELMDACPTFTSNTNTVDATCYGFNDGSIDLEVSGGSPPYSYQWSHGPQSQDLNNLLADTYTVVIQDAGICVLFDTLIIQQSPSGVPDNRYADNIASNSADLIFTPSIQVDQYRFRYKPLNASTWQVVGIGGLNSVPELDSIKPLNNLSSNTTYEWQMKAWSLNSCVDGWSSSKFFNTICVDVEIDTIPVTCHDAADGQISLQLNGIGLFSTTWSNQQSGNIISNLTPGLYVFTVFDTSGCSYTDSVFLNNPSPIFTGLPPSVFVCGDDTLIDVGVFNSVLWNTGATTSSILVDTTSLYTVQVTNANNCSTDDSVFVNVINGYPNLSSVTLCQGDSISLFAEGNGDYVNYWWPTNVISDSIQISPQQSTSFQLIVNQNNHSCYHTIEVEVVDMPIATFSTTPVSCFGGNDGASQVTVTNGTLPYSYLWSNGSTQNIANGLMGGYTYLEVLDSNNCSVLDSIMIQQPQEISLSATLTLPSCNSFSDASISVTASGGTPSYNYSWSNGDSTVLADSLSAGLYWLQIIDANNCNFLDTFLLTEPNELELTEDFSEHQDVLCFGYSTGEISLIASGGTLPYNFSSDDLNFQSSASFNSLYSGVYWFYVEDDNNCIDSIQLSITEPSFPLSIQEIVTSHQNVSCYSDNDGQFEVVGSGGNFPYQYIFNQDTLFIPLIDSLFAGSYLISILDANNCVSDTVVQITEPLELNASYSYTEPSCYGYSDGVLIGNASGGSPAYSFFWNSVFGDSITNITAGSYQLIVQDAFSCTDTMMIVLDQPEEIVLSEMINMHQDVSCYDYFDGQIQLSVTGGQPIYSFTQLPGLTQSSSLFVGIGAGSYTYVVADANNCTDSILVNILEPAQIVLSEDLNQHQDIICFNGNDGQFSVFASGGTPFYTYTLNGLNSQNFGLYDNLTAGNYQLLATDVNNCISDTFEVNILQPAQGVSLLEDTTFHQDVLCSSDSTGSIAVIAIGGTPGYLYSLDQNNWQTQDIFTDLSADLYTIFVSDSNSCIGQITLEITEPQMLTGNLFVNQVSCFGFSDASVTSQIQGGVMPYSYEWNDSSTADSLSNVAAGVYSLIVSDSNNCLFTDSIQVIEPAQIQISSTLTHVSCYNATDGLVNLNVNGGTPSYSFSLDAGPFLSSSSYNNLDVGSYDFTVLDANNCQDSISVTIEQPDSLFFSSTNIVDVQCFGDTNGFISVQANGGTPPFLYALDSGFQQLTGMFLNLGAQHYLLSVIDSNGCFFEDTFVVRQPDSMAVSMSVVNASCYGINDGELTVNVLSGGSPNYQYLLGNSGFSSLGSFTGLSAGTDSLFVQDSLGCIQSYLFEILQPDSLAISVEAQEPSCFESCDGYVQASIFGSNSYTLLWSNFDSGFLNDSLCDGLISLTVTDSLGCSNYYSYDLQQPPPVYPIITQNGDILQTDSTYLNYQWFDSNGFISGETDFHYSPSLSGTYWLQVTDSSGCSGTSLGYDFLISFTEELYQGWKVYPIPTINNLFIESDSEIAWRITDTQGKLLMKGVCSSYSEIDVSHLKKGIYVFQVLKENHTFIKKIIKQ